DVDAPLFDCAVTEPIDVYHDEQNT
ncbi:hypothetical protein EZS27_034433, partial [termite gut metagenome]